MSSKKEKDLGIKIGTKIEKLWTTVRDQAKQALEDHENSIIIQKEILAVAEKKIEEEKEKFK